MGLLDDLLESNSRGDADDFVKRYDRGEPYGLFGFQRGRMVASRPQLGRPA
jgi:hypothetical protein